jgi:uncharacterized membrane protein
MDGFDNPLPLHVQETVQTVAEIHVAHHRRATWYERVVRAIVAFVGSAQFAAGVSVVIALWIGINITLRILGKPPIDPFPFIDLQTVITLAAFYVALVILATQRHQSRLSESRAQLMLQLVTLAEQKASKTIELLMELRRDSPSVPNQRDEQAEAMAQSADARHVLDSLAEAQEQLLESD